MPTNKNKVVVITGAANGLGKALAFEFYKQGFDLALIDIDLKGLQEIKTGHSNANQVISTHIADISIEQNIVLARNEIIEIHKRVDILINNAAVSISQPFEMVSTQDYKKLFDTNFWGAVYCITHFLPDLKKQSESRLVNIISDFALMGFPGKTTYASSKSALMGFTHSLKTEMDAANLKVCLVIPPALNTNIVKNGLHISEQKKANEALFLEKNGMALETAAKKIVRGIIKGKFRIIVGAKMYWIDMASRIFPTWVHKKIGRSKKKFDFI